MPSRRLAAGRNSDAPRVPTLDASPETTNLVLVFDAIREARTKNMPRPESGGTPAIQPGAPASKAIMARRSSKAGQHERWATKAVRKAGPSVASSASDTLPHGMVAGRNMVVTRPTISVARRAAASSPKHPRFAYAKAHGPYRLEGRLRGRDAEAGRRVPCSGTAPGSRSVIPGRMQIAGPPLSVIQSPERRLH